MVRKTEVLFSFTWDELEEGKAVWARGSDGQVYSLEKKGEEVLVGRLGEDVPRGAPSVVGVGKVYRSD